MAMIEKRISALVFLPVILILVNIFRLILSVWNGLAGLTALPGLCCNTQDAALWSDSRFFVLAEAQLSRFRHRTYEDEVPGTEESTPE